MIPKLDSQSFTRFLTSVGLFLCVASLIAPALILRETTVLRIPATEVAGLTPVAQKEIERRQRVSRSVARAAPYAGAGAFLLGLVLVGLALPRMRNQEGVSDALSAAELRRTLTRLDPSEHEAEIEAEVEKQATEAETEAEVDKQATEAETEHAVEEQPAVIGQRDDAQAAGYLDEAVRVKAREAMMQARRLDKRVMHRLGEIKPPAYEVRTHVRLSGPPDLAIDALLFTEVDQLPDVLVEVEVFWSVSGPRTTHRTMNRAITKLTEYERRTGRRSVVWLVIVAADPSLVRLPARAEQDEKRLFTSVVSEEQLDDLRLPPLG